MKKYLLFLTLLLILLGGCSRKPAFDTSLLIGKWYAYNFEYEDGIESSTALAVVFANEKDVYMEAKFNIDGDYFGQIVAEGEYKVSGNTIKMNFPDSQIKFSVNKNFFDTSAEYDLALKEMKKEFLEDNEPLSETKVISISAQKLIVEDDGELIEFDKFH